MAVVTDLFVYPIKSCKGIRVESADLWETGLYLDRLWMVVDEAGRFLSQRTVPRLALVQTALKFGAFTCRLPNLRAVWTSASRGTVRCDRKRPASSTTIQRRSR